MFSQEHQKVHAGHSCFITVLVFLLVCFLLSASGEEQIHPRRVLVLYEAGTAYPGINMVDEGLRAAFDTSHGRLEVYREYMETILFPDPADQEDFREFYIRKYRDRQPDVIITVGPSALKFMIETHESAFPGVPIVFCVPYWVPSTLSVLDTHFTGVLNDISADKTIQAAVRLQHGTKHIVVVGGTSFNDIQVENAIKEQLRPYEGRFDISYITNLTMPDVQERLHQLPNHTIVLYCCMTRDAQGNKFSAGGDALSMVVTASNAPVFAMFDSFVYHGIVGGEVSSFFQQGRIAGGLAMRILNGEKTQDIPKVNAGTIPMFDVRALKRWNFDERDLPLGSIVLNREPTVWRTYKWYIIGGISLILLEAVLISGLTWHRKKLKNTEAELRKSQERLAGIVGTAMDAIITIDREQRIILFNTAAEKMFGCTQEKAIGTSIDQFISWGLNPDHVIAISGSCDSDVTTSAVGELQAMRLNGQSFPIEASISRVESDGKRLFTVIIRDITERRQAEDALASIGRRLIEAHEEERTWIGRELHDDINQRLALVAVEMDRWKQQLAADTKVCDQVQHTRQNIAEIVRDVQGLSHRLHSSKLEYLGLVAAAKSFCKELSEQHNVKIDFNHADMPPRLSKEISLCLFRVLQEALQNAVKHSGANYFAIDLRAISQVVQLIVTDTGAGFDQQATMDFQGLGLISMRERLQLVNGELLIKSEPTKGTTIRANVPIAKQQDVNRLAG